VARPRSVAPQGQRRAASRADFLNELSDLRRAVAELGDRMVMDYLAHALACFAKGKDEPGEAWLRLTLEQLGGWTGGPNRTRRS
jgi:hypothetical protein